MSGRPAATGGGARPQRRGFSRPEDVEIYNRHGPEWWDQTVPSLRLLANLVAPRMAFFDEVVPRWSDLRVLDLGCGGGFMSEELARRGARVVGVDPALAALRSGRRHAAEVDLPVGYLAGRGEGIPLAGGSADAVVCVDVLEHVDDLPEVLAEVGRVLRPGGLFLFDTIARTPLARLVLVYLAERVLGLLPRGTHDPAKFIPPRRLAAELEASGFVPGRMVGIGPVGVDRRLVITFGRLPFKSVMYLGSAVRR